MIDDAEKLSKKKRNDFKDNNQNRFENNANDN